MIDERGGGGFAVTSRDAHHFGIGVSGCKFYLANDADALIYGFLHHRHFAWDARTLHYLRGVKYLRLGVLPFFPFDAVAVEHLLVLVFDGSHVRDKHVQALLLGQYGRSHAAFGRT